MSIDREKQAGANTAGQSELIEPLEAKPDNGKEQDNPTCEMGNVYGRIILRYVGGARRWRS